MTISGISGFLAQVASNYHAHYLNMADDMASGRTPAHFRGGETPAYDRSEPTGSYYRPQLADRYIPSRPTQPTEEPVRNSRRKDGYKSKQASTPTRAADSRGTSADTAVEPKADSPLAKFPDGTYSYARTSQMDYQLDLKFSLGAVTQTVERLAEGDTAAVEQFAAAGFGLKAGLDITGSQVEVSSDVEGRELGRRREWSSAASRQRGGMSFANRSVGLDSFYDESSKVRRSLDESVKDTHRRTANRLALRYRFDNSFSMKLLSRFNVQTKKVEEQAPEATEQYLATTGELASKGTAEMMTGFFDAVDGYLNSAEEHLTDKIGSFLDQAAAELGFTEAEMAVARDHLTGTITSFFDRVDQALATVEATFTAPTAQTQQQLAQSYYNPASAAAAEQLATA